MTRKWDLVYMIFGIAIAFFGYSINHSYIASIGSFLLGIGLVKEKSDAE